MKYAHGRKKILRAFQIRFYCARPTGGNFAKIHPKFHRISHIFHK